MKTYQRLLLTEKQQTSMLADLDGIRYRLSLAQERLEERANEPEDGDDAAEEAGNDYEEAVTALDELIEALENLELRPVEPGRPKR